MTAVVPRITLAGQPFWTSRLQQLLATHAADLISVRTLTSIRDLHSLTSADVVVRVGYRPGASTWRGMAFDAAWSSFMALSRKARRAYYWIGTDVMNAQSEAANGTHSRWFAREAANAVHWAGSQWLADELMAIGVPARCALFPASLPREVAVDSLPKKFTVLTYIPDSRAGFYGGPELMCAAAELPEIDFAVFGGTGTWMTTPTPANVRFLGWLPDVVPAYLQSSVVARLVQHDALGGSVREALALGRYVLYTYPVPHTTQVPCGDTAAVVNRLRELASSHAAGTLQPNAAGMQYARSTFNPGRLTREFAMQLLGAAA